MEEKNEVKKSELVVPLLENFKNISSINSEILKKILKNKAIDEDLAEIIKSNVSAMCEIANTLNNVFGTY